MGIVAWCIIVTPIVCYLFFILKNKNTQLQIKNLLLQENDKLLQVNTLQIQKLELENIELKRRKEELLLIVQEKQLLNEQLEHCVFLLRQQIIPHSNLIKSLKETPAYISKETWQELFTIVNILCPHFRIYLMESHPQLTEGDFKYCCLIYLLFSTREIATLMNVVPDSVRRRERRILDKINQTIPQSELTTYLLSIN